MVVHLLAFTNNKQRKQYTIKFKMENDSCNVYVCEGHFGVENAMCNFQEYIKDVTMVEFLPVQNLSGGKKCRKPIDNLTYKMQFWKDTVQVPQSDNILADLVVQWPEIEIVQGNVEHVTIGITKRNPNNEDLWKKELNWEMITMPEGVGHFDENTIIIYGTRLSITHVWASNKMAFKPASQFKPVMNLKNMYVC